MKAGIRSFLANRFLLFSFVIALFPFNAAQAQDGMVFAYGFYKYNSYRVSVQKKSSYCDNYCFDDYFVLMNGYWQLSATNVRAKHATTNNKITGVSGAYVFRFEEIQLCSPDMPYAELGIGGALFNKKKFAGRNLGANTLFEITFGLGYRFGVCRQYDLGYKLVHFSNGYLARQNDGLNLHMLSFNYWFF